MINQIIEMFLLLNNKSKSHFASEQKESCTATQKVVMDLNLEWVGQPSRVP